MFYLSSCWRSRREPDRERRMTTFKNSSPFLHFIYSFSVRPISEFYFHTPFWNTYFLLFLPDTIFRVRVRLWFKLLCVPYYTHSICLSAPFTGAHLWTARLPEEKQSLPLTFWQSDSGRNRPHASGPLQAAVKTIGATLFVI